MTFTMWENELLKNTNTRKRKQEIASGGKFSKMYPKGFHTCDCINKILISGSGYSYRGLNRIWPPQGKKKGCKCNVIASLVNCFLSDSSGNLESAAKYDVNNQRSTFLAKRGQFIAQTLFRNN